MLTLKQEAIVSVVFLIIMNQCHLFVQMTWKKIYLYIYTRPTQNLTLAWQSQIKKAFYLINGMNYWGGIWTMVAIAHIAL